MAIVPTRVIANPIHPVRRKSLFETSEDHAHGVTRPKRGIATNIALQEKAPSLKKAKIAQRAIVVIRVIVKNGDSRLSSH